LLQFDRAPMGNGMSTRTKLIAGAVSGGVFGVSAIFLAGRQTGDEKLVGVALGFLFVISFGLVCVGLFALFGRPRSHRAKKLREEVTSGFQLGGGIVIGFVLMTALVGSSSVALGITHSPRISRTAAIVITFVSIVLIASMIQRWAKYFVGWIGYSVLNGLLMISSGHLVNNPSIPVPRWYSVSATALLLASALSCLRFTKDYKLNALDKSAVMAWVLAFTTAICAGSGSSPYRQAVGLATICTGCGALVVAWLFQKHSAPKRRHARSGVTL
jgi:hypothetical protein